MIQKLYVTKKVNDASADLCMIVAKMSKIQVAEEEVAKGSEVEKDLQKRVAGDGLTLTYPVLETADGDLITQSLAICQFLAAMGSSPSLIGTTAWEESQVDQWMSFLQTKTMAMAKIISAHAFGTITLEQPQYQFINQQLKDNTKIINNSLKQKIWLCGTAQPTIADIQLALSIQELQQCIIDKNTRNSWNNLNQLFKKIVDLPEVRSRLGAIK